MGLIEWDETLVLGIAEMDDSHRELVRVMNRCGELDHRGASAAECDAALGELLAVTREHFAEEEQFMAAIGFPDLARHRQVHDSMLARLEGCLRLRAAGEAAPGAFFEFLAFWLRTHTRGLDRVYAEYAAQRVG